MQKIRKKISSTKFGDRKIFETIYLYHSGKNSIYQIQVFQLDNEEKILSQNCYDYKFFFDLNRSLHNFLLKFLLISKSYKRYLYFLTPLHYDLLFKPNHVFTKKSYLYFDDFKQINKYIIFSNRFFRTYTKSFFYNKQIEQLKQNIVFIRSLKYTSQHKLFKCVSISQNTAPYSRQIKSIKEKQRKQIYYSYDFILDSIFSNIINYALFEFNDEQPYQTTSIKRSTSSL